MPNFSSQASKILPPSDILFADIDATIWASLTPEEYENIRPLIIQWIEEGMRSAHQQGRAEEREACAKVAETMFDTPLKATRLPLDSEAAGSYAAHEIATAIRGRVAVGKQ